MSLFGVLFAILVADSACFAAAGEPLRDIRQAQSPHVLLLGTFHFNDAGLDGYKPKHVFDVRSAARQRELQGVLDRLAAWKPTRIVIEAAPARQARLDSLYAVYPGGGLDTLRNETFQIGFQLAKRLGLPGVLACDAPGRDLDPSLTDEEYTRRSDSLQASYVGSTAWDPRFLALYAHDDSVKTVWPLARTLRYLNSEERLRAGHGHYLVGDLLRGPVGDYLGADGFASSWYNRNLRIYSNIARSMRGPEERVLVLYGAGHVPILRELFRASPVAVLDELDTVLR